MTNHCQLGMVDFCEDLGASRMIPKKLQSRIEELALEKYPLSYWGSGMDEMEHEATPFQDGATAMHAELEPVLREAIDILELCNYLPNAVLNEITYEPNYPYLVGKAIDKLREVIE